MSCWDAIMLLTKEGVKEVVDRVASQFAVAALYERPPEVIDRRYNKQTETPRKTKRQSENGKRQE